MRRWRDAAAASARGVSALPAAWVAGALAWLVSVGWIPLIVTVGRPPTIADLTFIGARIVTSGSWPWNAVLTCMGLLVVLGLAFAAVAWANAALIALDRHRPATTDDVLRLVRVALVASMPLALALGTLVSGAYVVAPGQFNAPDPEGGPLVSTMVRLAPLILALGVTGLAALAVTAVGGRVAVAHRIGTLRAIAASARAVLRPSALVQMAISVTAAGVYLGLATLLLGVLWAPIGEDLRVIGAFDLRSGLLLVGFVAVWLCVVLAGGAIHAWSAATWSALVATDASVNDRSSTWKT